jgi:hypothetical protein
MNETEAGHCWDIGFDSEKKRDVVFIDTGDDTIALSKDDLISMLTELEGYDS